MIKPVRNVKPDSLLGNVSSLVGAKKGVVNGVLVSYENKQQGIGTPWHKNS
jgi:hypothetical protein